MHRTMVGASNGIPRVPTTNKFGIACLTVAYKKLHHDNGYLLSMGTGLAKPSLGKVRRDAFEVEDAARIFVIRPSKVAAATSPNWI